MGVAAAERKQEVRAQLAASRTRAHAVLERAAAEVQAMAADSGEQALLRAAERLAEIERAQVLIDHHAAEIEAGYVRLVEALAAATQRLVEIAREADFSPPPWPGGIVGRPELRLHGLRERTLNVQVDRGGGRWPH